MLLYRKKKIEKRNGIGGKEKRDRLEGEGAYLGTKQWTRGKNEVLELVVRSMIILRLTILR